MEETIIQSQMIQKETATQNNKMYIAIELSSKKWKLLFGNGVKRRQKTINSIDSHSLKANSEIAEILNKRGYKSGQGHRIDSRTVIGITHGYKLKRVMVKSGV